MQDNALELLARSLHDAAARQGITTEQLVQELARQGGQRHRRLRALGKAVAGTVLLGAVFSAKVAWSVGMSGTCAQVLTPAFDGTSGLITFCANQKAYAEEVNHNFQQVMTYLEAKVGTAGTAGVSTTSVAASGDVSADTVTAASITASGDISAASSTIMGTLAANSVTAATGVSAATLDASDTATVGTNLTLGNNHAAASSYLFEAAPSGYEASVMFQTRDTVNATSTTRWLMGKSTSPETGSNAGSDFFINRYNDAGTFQNQPFRIMRASGFVHIGGGTPSSTLHVTGTLGFNVKSNQSVATAMDATSSVWFFTTGTGTITLPTASTVTGRIYLVMNQTGSSKTTSSYFDLANTAQTTLANGASLWVISDGTNWRQVK